MGIRPKAASGRTCRRDEAGIALVWTIFATMLIASVIVAGTDTRRAIDTLATADFAARGQAESVAQAGFVDAYAWFRRQQVQPVTTFAPRRDLSAVPPVNETDDPTIGLVRDYEISQSVWGRYEVRLHQPAEPFTDQDGEGRYEPGEPFVDQNGDGVRNPDRETHDISIGRGLPGAGGVWRIVSHGFIFRRPRLDLPLGQGPNVRVASSHVAGEVRRLTITPPATAAVCARTGGAVTIGARTRILGGTRGGIISRSGTGSPVIASGAEVSGTPRTGSVSGYSDTVSSVFGVTLAQLKGMADASYSDGLDFPRNIGEYTLSVVEGDVAFDSSRPLRGTGIVVVTGDCTLSSGSNSFFNGLLYVQGDLTVRAPSFLRGTVVVQGSVNIAGTGGDYVEIDYDPSMVVSLLTLMGQYRHSMSLHAVIPTLSDGTPDEVAGAGGERGIGGMGTGGGA
jgi:hypothetical protein